jgi:hypothetical protein
MLAMNDRTAVRRPNRRSLKLDCLAGEAAHEFLARLHPEHELASHLGTPFAVAGWPSQAVEYVASATVRETGRVVGMITASRQLTSAEPVLLLLDMLLDPTHHPAMLLRRLVARVLLHLAGSDGMPAAVAARAAGGKTVETFLSLQDHFTGSVAYPSAAGEPVTLSTARLAKRIAAAAASSIRYDLATSALRGGRLTSADNGNLQGFDGASTAFDLHARRPMTACDEVLLVIDLRSEDETVLIDDARRAYRKP